MELKELKEQAKNLDPVIRIGKYGVTDNVHQEVEKLLKKRKLIKIKILNNCPIEDKEGLIRNIIEKSGSTLILKVGYMFSIYRESSKKSL